jgi:Transposase DDE domain group 1
MIVQSALPLEFEFLGSQRVEVEASEAPLSSDAGLLPIREFDRRLGWTEGFAAQLSDPRRGCDHALVEMVQQRVFGILAGYADQNDHDTLRSDPIFKLIAGRSPTDNDLASQPTLSRFENAVTASDLLRLEAWYLEQFILSFEQPPDSLTLDIDLFDDPTHGQQQLTFFHGYYNQYQYEVRLITCAENDQIAFPVLLHGTADGRLGLLPDLERVVRRLRQAWPDVQIRWRGDCGFTGPTVYEGCEALAIEYTLGLTMNPRLKKLSDETLEMAVQLQAQTGQPQRLFTAFDYQADSWNQPRWVVVKCEASAQGINRRAVVTNRRGARVCPAGAYDDYADRGESENRNKELKCELMGDRLSDHRYLANCFRLFLHTLACNLLARLRRIVANPPLPPKVEPDMPVEARSPKQKRRRHNERRQADPLGEGHACTWRTMLIKVAATIIVSTRRVRVLLSGSWPYFHFFQAVTLAILGFTPPKLSTG